MDMKEHIAKIDAALEKAVFVENPLDAPPPGINSYKAEVDGVTFIVVTYPLMISGGLTVTFCDGTASYPGFVCHLTPEQRKVALTKVFP